MVKGTQDSGSKNDKLLRKVWKDLKYSSEKFQTLFNQIKEDFEFEQGNMWDKSDVEDLRKRGILALTINKIKPIIKLITGIERQSKSDYVAFPEGEEDQLSGEIASRLLKNISKVGNLPRKFSEVFKHGAIGGPSYLEPYIDYSKDLINGEMKFRKISGMSVYLDPDGQEYDLSDHKFVIKVTSDLTRDDLLILFPDDEKKINNIANGKISPQVFDNLDAHIQGLDYPALDSKDAETDPKKEDVYDLIDYFYKKPVDAYFVASPERGLLKRAPSKDEAQQVADQIPNAIVISKKENEIRHVQVIGNVIFFDDVLWSYPAWRSYPIIPYFAELITENLSNKSLTIQGLVRGIRDLNLEFNKRRTQELAHLNASTNSGWMVPKDSMSSEDYANLKKRGSAPGFVGQYDPVKGKPEKEFPTPLSQGHAQLAEENAQDLKEASGVNPDLLANASQSQSGRAILLKQRQGLVMIQELLDNFSETKKIMGKFILSQLREMYTIESAMRVVGDSWVKENFTVPVTAIIQRGLEKMVKDEQPTELEQSYMLQYPNNSADTPVVDERGQLVTVVDFDSAMILINQVLNDNELGKYDVSVGEGPFNETIRLSNFLGLTDLASQGVPIPPNVLIEMSLIPEAEKKKIIEQTMQQQQAMVQAQQQETQLEAKKHTDEMSIKQAEVEIKKFLAQIKAIEANIKASEAAKVDVPTGKEK